MVHALRVTADHRSIGTEDAEIRAKRGGFLNHSVRRAGADGTPVESPGSPWMPIYEFECEECGSRFDELVARDAAAPPCPSCGATRARRLISSFCPAPAPAARGRGPLRRIAASREGIRRIRSGSPAIGRQTGEGRTALSATAEQRREALVELFNEVKGCTRCPLHETRTKAVFGAGNADAELMFVGEAPGAEEDRQGLPFVGRAGQLLNQMLEGIGLSREDVFIANVLKSRPPGNRDPQPLEIEACRPYLFEQVRLIEPKVVCTLGNFATKLLSGNPAGITRVRGTPQVHELGGRTVFLLPLFHPAAALRTPAVKETLRGDFATIPDLLAGPPPAPAPERRGGRRAGGRGRLDRRRRRPTSSTCSAEPWSGSEPAPPPRPKRSGRGSPPASRPATSSSSPATSGAGKTTLIRGACRALGVEEPGHLADLHDRPALRGAGVPVSHLDLYRLAGLEDEDPALLDDYLTADAIAFVEWPAAAGRGCGRRRWRCGCATPAATAGRSSSVAASSRA